MPKYLGVLNGGRVVRRRFGPGGVEDDIWYVMYEFPEGSGKFAAYEFNSPQQFEKVMGKYAGPIDVVTDAWYNRNVLAEADAEEVIGRRDTNWKAVTTEMMADAAREAGIRDPSIAGAIANDPEMQQIMVMSTVGNWTPEQVLAEQRNTRFWKETLYPGIENLYAISADPERDYAEYMQQVTPALVQLGYQKDANGTFKNQVARMLENNIDSNIFVSQVPTFIRATQNAEFATVLNAWAERDLGRTVDFNDWFDLMAGESQPELDEIAERATLEWVAQNQGTALSQSEVESIAGRTQMTADEMQRFISEFNVGILGLGEALGRYGLTRDEVLSASAGIAPESGRTVDEVKLLVAKTARENDLFDEQKINFYVGFNPQGQPTRPGLAALSPEGA